MGTTIIEKQLKNTQKENKNTLQGAGYGHRIVEVAQHPFT